MDDEPTRPDDDGPSGNETDPGNGRQYHLEVGPGDVAPTVLMPGDPDRVPIIANTWDGSAEVARHREFRTVTGRTGDVPISATSTGIGSPSAAIAVEELARVGVETMIRVGSCGALDPEIEIGDLVITRGAVRQEGTSEEYVRTDYPAAADERVVGALVAAAEALDHPYHVGLTLSADSFYTGQARDGFRGYRPSMADHLLDDLRAANVANIEMEASVILTLANLYGLRAGAICTVYANRSTGEFRTEGQLRAAEVATHAVELLSAMDDRVAASDASRWHPGVGLAGGDN